MDIEIEMEYRGIKNIMDDWPIYDALFKIVHHVRCLILIMMWAGGGK